MAIQQTSPYRAIAREWLSLVERRKAHLIELRAVNLAYERFADVAGLPPHPVAAAA
jgi:hypothetical protein